MPSSRVNVDMDSLFVPPAALQGGSCPLGGNNPVPVTCLALWDLPADPGLYGSLQLYLFSTLITPAKEKIKVSQGYSCRDFLTSKKRENMKPLSLPESNLKKKETLLISPGE